MFNKILLEADVIDGDKDMFVLYVCMPAPYCQ